MSGSYNSEELKVLVMICRLVFAELAQHRDLALSPEPEIGGRCQRLMTMLLGTMGVVFLNSSVLESFEEL